MSWPDPLPGLVIRYAYLWRREAASGQEEGAKDRPCAIVLARADQGGRTRVYVLPVTHSEPARDADAVEIPATVKARLGLDAARSWVVVTEANVFTWPGPDLRFQPGRGAESAAYGFLPPGLFRLIRDRFLAAHRGRVGGMVARSE